MRPLRRTVIACSLALLALLIGPLGWWGYQQVIPDEHLSFYSPSRAAIAELSTRARESASTDPLGRITIEEELANEIFGLDHP